MNYSNTQTQMYIDIKPILLMFVAKIQKFFASLLLLLLLCLVHVQVQAQECGCSTCPVAITGSSPTTVCYNVFNLSNDNLASSTQCVERVSLTFKHEFVLGMEVSLFAPDGTEIQLIGEYDPFAGLSTNVGAIFDVSFVPNRTVANPDNGNSPRWTSSDFDAPANYTGSYYPFDKDLEFFSTGTANGQWCLEIENIGPNSGEIIDFSIEFCDESGRNCCFADAGRFDKSDFSACAGDPSLALNGLVPIYGVNPPDALSYSYAYVIAQGGIIEDIEHDLNNYPDFSNATTYPQGTYTVCGLSYAKVDKPNIPTAPFGALTIEDMRNDLDSNMPSFCGELMDDCVEVTIGTAPPPVQLREYICDGDTFEVGDSVFTTSVQRTIVMETQAGCDSIVELDLTVLQPSVTEMQSVTVCKGESYTIGINEYDTTDTYDITIFYSRNTSCDSVKIILDFTVLPELETTIDRRICPGSTYQQGDSTYTRSGTYSNLFTSFDGCDSTVILNLEVDTIDIVIAQPDVLTCDNSIITLDAGGSDQRADYVYKWEVEGAVGNIVGADDGRTAQVDQAGTYRFTIIDPSTGNCTETETITVTDNIQEPTAIILENGTLTCAVTEIQLNADNSTGQGTLTYEWQTIDGNIVGDNQQQSVLLDQPGTYQLTVTDAANGCSNSTTMLVVADRTPPAAVTFVDEELTCALTEITLDGTGSAQGPDITYQWTTNDGVILSGENTLTPLVGATGIYTLEVVDGRNGCNRLATALVNGVYTDPIVTIRPITEQITCVNNSVEIDASNSSAQGAGISANWTTTDGQFLAGTENSLITTVTAAGTYEVTITNQRTGCETTSTVQVDNNLTPPTAVANNPNAEQITCRNQSVILDGTASSGMGILTYTWTEPTGTLVGNTSSVSVNDGGLYTLVVTDDENGCTDTAQVSVGKNTLPPVAEAGVTVELNCINVEQTLDGSASESGNNTSYMWNGPSVSSGSATVNPTVDVAGMYYLTVLNSITGCTAVDSVLVTLDDSAPVADAGVSLVLTCNDPVLQLDGTASSTGNNISYLWTSVDNHPISNPTTLTPSITRAGEYSLQVTDNNNQCSTTDVVEVNDAQNPPVVQAGVDGVIDCNNSTYTPNTNGSDNGGGFSYNWTTTNGSIMSGANTLTPVFDTEGVYVLEIENTLTGCKSTDEVRVSVDIDTPTPVIDPVSDLTCQEQTRTLNGASSTAAHALSYEWQTADGNFTTPIDAAQVTIDQAGRYTLIVTDLVNGCTESTSIEVGADTNIPTAVAASQLDIDCGSGTVEISGVGSSTGANITYSWSTPNGRYRNTSDDLIIIAEAAGDYTLVVSNTANNCFSETTVTVRENCVPQSVIVTNTSLLTCYEPTTTLYATGSSMGDNFTLKWLDINNMTLGTRDSLLVSTQGEYRLEVTSQVSGQTDVSRIMIDEDKTPPVVDAGPDRAIDCNNPTVELDGSRSSDGNDFQLVWTTLGDGFIDADSITLTPTVNLPGVYELEITDMRNGCRATDVVRVLSNGTTLDASCVNSAVSFVCGQTEIILDAGCISQDPNISYAWTTTDGSIVSGNGSAELIVNQKGRYTLDVEDSSTGCRATTTVEVSQPSCSIDVNVNPDETITCNRRSVRLKGEVVPANNNYILSWEDGNNNEIAQGAEVTVSDEDVYTFVVKEPASGTEERETVRVTVDTIPPIIDAGMDVQLDCQTTNTTLSVTTNLNNATYQWSASGGQTISTPNAADITVTEIGVYAVAVTNPDNACVTKDTVLVEDGVNTPTAFAGQDTMLTCTNTSLTLSGVGSTVGNNIRYNWTVVGQEGSICSQADILRPTVCGKGTYQLEVTDVTTGCSSTATVNVGENKDAPVISAGNGATLNCINPTLTLSGTGPTGATYTQKWEDEDNMVIATDTYTPTISQAGEYRLTVIDLDNGCSSQERVIVRIDTISPSIDAGATLMLQCGQNGVVLNGAIANNTRSYDIVWTGAAGDVIDNSTSLNPTVYQDGMYQLVVTDRLNGCQSQDSVQVTLDNNAPSSVAGEDKALTCDQEQVILLGSSDATDVTYEWQDINGTIVANQPNFTVTQAGTYRLIVTSTTNNCSQVDEVTVTDNRVEPNVSIQTLRTLLNCANSTTVLRAERANITDNYTYEWINTNTNSILGTEDSLLVSEAGTYQLVVIDPINGCRSTLSQSIDADDDLPTISIANVPTFECDTESVQLSASADGDNLSFAWTTADGDTITNATDVTVLLPGFYTFTATNLDNGCASSTTVQVARSAEIPSVVINSRITELTCTDNEIELQGDTSAGLNYEWSDEEGQTVGLESNLIVNTAGRYLLTVTNPQTNCSNSDSITITAEDAFINGLDLKLTAPTCIGEGRGSVVVSNVFGGTAPYSYALDGAAFKTYPQFDFLPPATYTLTVEDAFGCQRDTIFTINEGESIAVDLGGDREISLGESIVIEVQANDEIDQLEWDTTDSLECSDCPSQTVTPLETTTYGVMVMNAEGCMAMDEIIVNVSKERLLYLPTAFSPDGDGSNEVFFVGVGQDVERIEEMSIYDRWGTLLFSVSDIPPNDARYGWDGKFKGNTLRTNIYIYKATIRFTDGFVQTISGDVLLRR